MKNVIRPAIVMFLVLSAVTGVLYPLCVTLFAQALFPEKATGSLIIRNGKAAGSSLIAQPFTDFKYFWPRPSAANYDAMAGAGSNLAPSNPASAQAVQARVDALRAADPENRAPIPVDLVTASGSGLDPHISLAAALFQLPRVARARRLSESQVRRLIDAHLESSIFALNRDLRVNVLELNLALDDIHPD